MRGFRALSSLTYTTGGSVDLSVTTQTDPSLPRTCWYAITASFTLLKREELCRKLSEVCAGAQRGSTDEGIRDKLKLGRENVGVHVLAASFTFKDV